MPDHIARSPGGRYGDALRTLEEAIDIAPSPDSICWQRASYRRRLNLPGEVDDPSKLLDAPSPQTSAALTALLKLLDTPSPQAELEYLLALPTELPDFHSPALDTEPLETADPLTCDFPGIDPYPYVASAFQRLRLLRLRPGSP